MRFEPRNQEELGIAFRYYFMPTGKTFQWPGWRRRTIDAVEVPVVTAYKLEIACTTTRLTDIGTLEILDGRPHFVDFS
jgi:hypothetical protein